MDTRRYATHSRSDFDRQDDTIQRLLMRIFQYPIQPGERRRVINTMDFTGVHDLGKATVFLDEVGFEIEEYEIHRLEGDGSRRVSVVFSIEMELTEENLVRMGKFLEDVAGRFNGTYASDRVALAE